MIAMKGRPRTEQRNPLVLNLARKGVRDHVLKTIDDLVTQNDIPFLKRDHNRNWSEPGWLGVAPDEDDGHFLQLSPSAAALSPRPPGARRADVSTTAATAKPAPYGFTKSRDRLCMIICIQKLLGCSSARAFRSTFKSAITFSRASRRAN